MGKLTWPNCRKNVDEWRRVLRSIDKTYEDLEESQNAVRKRVEKQIPKDVSEKKDDD